MPDMHNNHASTVSRTGLWLGPTLALLVLCLPAPASLAPEAHLLAAITVLMATWWISDALPVAVTALLPLALFPILGILSADNVARNYGHNLIWLFFGGFQIAFAIERCGLHRRVAMYMLGILGTRPEQIVLGFMLAAALLSMWLINTSVTVMLLPVALAVARTVDHKGFGQTLMLGIAYAASTGGIGTYIGTAPNGIFYQQTSLRGIAPDFGGWMLFAMPLSLLLTCFIWFYLTRVSTPDRHTFVSTRHPELQSSHPQCGRWSQAEIAVATVFLVTVCAWISRRFVLDAMGLEANHVSDSTIAIFATIALYLLRIKTAQGRWEPLLCWQDSLKTPWHILLLFGGGFALGTAFQSTGLSAWLGGLLAQATLGWPLGLRMLAVVLFISFLTELTSNTATSIILLPVIGDLAVASGTEPLLLMAPAVLAASCAFMLPVATPPNAVVYGSGLVRLPDMAKTGLGLNLSSGVLIVLWTLSWGQLVL